MEMGMELRITFSMILFSIIVISGEGIIFSKYNRMKLTYSQPFDVGIQIINESIDGFDLENEIVDQDRIHIFNFDFRKAFPKNAKSQILTFTRQFYRILLLNLFGQKEQNQWRQATINANHITKHFYCKLVERMAILKSTQTMELILFLITLVSRKFLENVVDSNWKDDFLFEEDLTNKFQVEEYVYIVLTFQTTGNLISPKTFEYLRKKYIQKTIYKSSQTTAGIIKSLKHIKKQLAIHSTKIIQRKAKERQFSTPNSAHMIKFIKDNLKTQINFVQNSNREKDPVMNSMGQTFYNKINFINFSPIKQTKLVNKKIMLRQLSTAVVTNYNFKQQTPQTYSKSQFKFPVKRSHKRISSNLQIFNHEQEKKNQTLSKMEWKEVITNLKADSEKNISKIQRVPMMKMRRFKSRCLNSEPNSVPCSEKAYRDLMRKIRKSKEDVDGKIPITKDSKLRIHGDQNNEDNLLSNLKTNCRKPFEKRSAFPVQDEWKSTDLLKKKEKQFQKKCIERREKIKDSIANIPFKIY